MSFDCKGHLDKKTRTIYGAGEKLNKINVHVSVNVIVKNIFDIKRTIYNTGEKTLTKISISDKHKYVSVNVRSSRKFLR